MSVASNTRHTYRMERGGLHWRFHQSRAKIQMFGGGFGNGKTSSMCVKALSVGKDYQGASILMARSTYPKLNDTLRKEFLKWCPRNWIKRSVKDENVVELNNGTTYYFRYIAQQGKSMESSTSNLLSATYDAIFVDQIEDPEIQEKDFDDLLGRLRGSTPYRGNDETMPRTGPRWFVISCNPTRNWVYNKLVKPLHYYLKTGFKHPDLLVDVDTGEPLMELFEGSTYENKDNLPEDFIKTLEATYKGQMRDRFLNGEWSAYEGLVYPMFDDTVHVVSHQRIEWYFNKLRRDGYNVEILEGYDHGLAQQSCYLFGFVDPYGNVLLLDGFYEKELPVDTAAKMIHDIRRKYMSIPQYPIFADPSIFRRTPGDKRVVGRTVAGMFEEENVRMQRGNNDKLNGIIKVSSYLHIQDFHVNPLDGTGPAPYLYISSDLSFVVDEFGDYYWKKDNATGEPTDEPVDRKDHAMDTIKYMLSRRPRVSVLLPSHKPKQVGYMRWGERELSDKRKKSARHLSNAA